MDSIIERTLDTASKRALYPEEIKRLDAYIRAQESRALPREDVLVRRIRELEGQLVDCHARVRKCERNGCPD